jgi:3'-phosphoadenosine 5'-phosphosulfate (PAPS) 3'-phosphatase
VLLQRAVNTSWTSRQQRCRVLRLCCVCCLQDHGVEFKGDESPLTKADTESNRIICEGLQRVSPHVPIISEENKTLPHSIRKVSAAALDTRYVLFVVRSEMCHSSTSWACCTAAVPPAGKCIALIAGSAHSALSPSFRQQLLFLARVLWSLLSNTHCVFTLVAAGLPVLLGG